MLYVAYGSNINQDQMKYRCPKAQFYGVGKIHNWKLDFHGTDGNAYATITQSVDSEVPVVLYKMSDADEKVMDHFEGYPVSYFKKKIAVYVAGEKKFGTVYIMNLARTVARPSRKYVNTIRFGYEQVGFDPAYLDEALIRNAKEFYQDDLLEVREFKPASWFDPNRNSKPKNVKSNPKKKAKSVHKIEKVKPKAVAKPKSSPVPAYSDLYPGYSMYDSRNYSGWDSRSLDELIEDINFHKTFGDY